MKRYHLFEFEDLGWFPNNLRNLMTDFLRTVVEKFDLFGGVVPVLSELISETGESNIVDLASGGGGPWRSVLPRLQKDHPQVCLKLTDLYPNQDAWKQVLAELSPAAQYESTAVDARDVPDRFSGIRTQFLSLHHFRPGDVQKIFLNAVANQAPIAVFEAQQRRLTDLIRFSLSPIMVFLITPWIRPFKLSRFFWTYAIPILPLLVGWDGVVSVLRTYFCEEMLQLARQADPQQLYHWKSEILESGRSRIPYLTGRPKHRLNSPA